MQALDWRQKKSFRAAERDTERVKMRCRTYVEAVQKEEVTRFDFVDETITNLPYCRCYAHAESGQRVGHGVPLHGGPNVTVVAALTPNGLQAAMTGSGAVNGDVFAAYLEQVLGPTLMLGDAVVLDSQLAHQVARLAKIGAAREAFLLYLPLHSPDFNPIKLAFSKLKTWLYMVQTRTSEALVAPIQTATE